VRPPDRRVRWARQSRHPCHRCRRPASRRCRPSQPGHHPTCPRFHLRQSQLRRRLACRRCRLYHRLARCRQIHRLRQPHRQRRHPRWSPRLPPEPLPAVPPAPPPAPVSFFASRAASLLVLVPLESLEQPAAPIAETTATANHSLGAKSAEASLRVFMPVLHCCSPEQTVRPIRANAMNTPSSGDVGTRSLCHRDGPQPCARTLRQATSHQGDSLPTLFAPLPR
jgi:hypothetical protein